MGSRRTILITAMGTRGDVQPFVALGLHMRDVRGWRVVLAVPPEYRSFVEDWGLEAEVIGISLQQAIASSPQGRALRTASVLTALQATRDFFRLPLLESWFASIRRLLTTLCPDVLLLSGFVAMAGAAALPALLGLPTRVVLAYTIPMLPTAEFAMPLAGTGFTAPAAWMNKLQWAASQALVSEPLHMARAQAIVDGAAAAAATSQQQLLQREQRQRQLSKALSCDGWLGSASLAGGSRRGSSSTSGSSSESGSPLSACASPCSSPWSAPCSPTDGSIKLSRSLTPSPVPTLYIYSPSLLPKPADWPAHSHVVGPLLLRRQPPRKAGAAAEPQQQSALQQQAQPQQPQQLQQQGQEDAEHQRQQAKGGSGYGGTGVGLPAALQCYLDAAARAQLPVVYIGLGSMLGTVFEPAEVRRLLGCMEQAVRQLAASTPLCAIIHTNVLPGSSDKAQHHEQQRAGSSSGSSDSSERAHSSCDGRQDGGTPPSCMLLSVPVPHELLLPQVDLVVHHGGAGTTQAALLAGKPSMVVPCVPSSDQPFWADLVARRGLGPPWFPVRRLTAARLAAGIRLGLANLRAYTAAAEALAYRMAREDGARAAADVLEAALAES